jgi:hypothetical protein
LLLLLLDLSKGGWGEGKHAVPVSVGDGRARTREGRKGGKHGRLERRVRVDVRLLVRVVGGRGRRGRELRRSRRSSVLPVGSTEASSSRAARPVWTPRTSPSADGLLRSIASAAWTDSTRTHPSRRKRRSTSFRQSVRRSSEPVLSSSSNGSRSEILIVAHLRRRLGVRVVGTLRDRSVGRVGGWSGRGGGGRAVRVEDVLLGIGVGEGMSVLVLVQGRRLRVPLLVVVVVGLRDEGMV